MAAVVTPPLETGWLPDTPVGDNLLRQFVHRGLSHWFRRGFRGYCGGCALGLGQFLFRLGQFRQTPGGACGQAQAMAAGVGRNLEGGGRQISAHWTVLTGGYMRRAGPIAKTRHRMSSRR